MPMYDFYCTECAHEFEDMVGSNEACPPCPECGSSATERLVCAPNLKKGAMPFKVGPVRPMPKNKRPPCGGGCSGCGTI